MRSVVLCFMSALLSLVLFTGCREQSANALELTMDRIEGEYAVIEVYNGNTGEIQMYDVKIVK